MSEAQEKKVFYNRVRRTCKLFNIDIVYDGPPMAYGAVDLFKDGEALGIGDKSTNNRPLNTNWKMIHERLGEMGFHGGIK